MKNGLLGKERFKNSHRKIFWNPPYRVGLLLLPRDNDCRMDAKSSERDLPIPLMMIILGDIQNM